MSVLTAVFASVGIAEIWAVDFEFRSLPGECPEPICMVARELRSQRTIRWWVEEMRRARTAPYSTDSSTLVLGYYFGAEAGCHLALGWPVPANVLDLYVEFRNLTNGLPPPAGVGLLGALTYFGIPTMEAAEKDSMRALALRGGPWTADERKALLEYCESDVTALERLLAKMMPRIDIRRALLRGRYMKAVARMERTGVPVNVDELHRLKARWAHIDQRLIEAVDRDYGVFEGKRFKAERWRAWIASHGIPWPELPSGAQSLDADTFREMARMYPSVNPIRELRASLSQLRLSDLAVGRDGRNRCMLSAFRARTGRNQPSNAQFIFGPAVWIRRLIQAPPGHALVYIDWCQQEFGIAAALSGDPAMMAAYISGDPYLTFAIQAGAAPAGATKLTHVEVRERFKLCALAVQYGMGEATLAQRIGLSHAHARQLLELHRHTYPRFWAWSDAALDHAMLVGMLPTVFGWEIHVDANINPRSLRNFPMQGNGAEMLRMACCFATEQGIRVCAPVHDALLVEGRVDEIEGVVAATRKAMSDASKIVLGGFELRSEAKIFAHPARFADPRGEAMWRTVWEVIEELEQAETAEATRARVQQDPCIDAHPVPLMYVDQG